MSGQGCGRQPHASDAIELYSVPVTGGASINLNSHLPDGGNAFNYGCPQRITGDSSTVIYYADQEEDDRFELFSVPIDGGQVTKLNKTPVPGGEINCYFALSPDDSTVVYLADQDTDDVRELYRVNSSGGGLKTINGTLAPGGDVSNFIISPDSSTVVYIADQETDGVDELYAVASSRRRPPVHAEPPLPADGDIRGLIGITPDSSTVVYKADQETDELVEIYQVPIAGGAASKLNGELVAGGSVETPAAITADGAGLVYRARQYDNDVVELFAVGLDPDADSDGVLGLCGDCDEANGDTYPDAPEVNDGIDNQCPGDAGQGVTDEISGDSGFHAPDDPDEFSWTPQAGATLYEVARSDGPDFSACTSVTTADAFWIDPDLPAAGAVFHYLSRPLTPHAGSWGQDSDADERFPDCSP